MKLYQQDTICIKNDRNYFNQDFLDAIMFWKGGRSIIYIFNLNIGFYLCNDIHLTALVFSIKNPHLVSGT